MCLDELLVFVDSDETVNIGVLNEFGFIVWGVPDIYRGFPVMEMYVDSVGVRNGELAIILKAPF